MSLLLLFSGSTATTHESSGALTAGSAEVSGSAVHPTLYFVIGPASGWVDPTAANVKAGQLFGGGPATASGSTGAPSTTTNPFTWPTEATGLASATSYKIAFVWSNGTTDVGPEVSASWDTTGGTHASSGALTADAATIAGTALRTLLHESSGALTAQSATTAGTGARVGYRPTSGALTAQSATTAGTSARVGYRPTSGALTAQSATVAGTGARTKLHESSGALSAQDAVTDGSATKFRAHASSGALTTGSAEVAGSSTVTLASGPKSSSGALTSGSAEVSGSSEVIHVGVQKGAGRSRKRRKYATIKDGRILITENIDEAIEWSMPKEEPASEVVEKPIPEKRKPEKPAGEPLLRQDEPVGPSLQDILSTARQYEQEMKYMQMLREQQYLEMAQLYESLKLMQDDEEILLMAMA